MENALCDTNVVSELMKKVPSLQVVAWMERLSRIHLSVITVEEIIFGLRRRSLKAKEAWFERFIDQVCVVHPIDRATSERAGICRGQLSSRGEQRSQADVLIAATAWRKDLVVVTRNVDDFLGTGVPVFNPFEAF